MDFNDKNRYKQKKKKRKDERIFKKRKNFLVIALIIVLFIAIVALGVYLVKDSGLNLGGSKNSENTSDSGSSPTNPEASQTASPTEPKPEPAFEISSSVTARNVLVADLNSSKVLASKGSSDKIYPASLTKLAAALVIAENCTPGELFTVGDELSFVQPGSSTAKLKEGNIIALEGMLDALLLASGNDASYTSALHVGRKAGGDLVKSDLDALHYFVGMMNTKAKELGAKNTNFLNPDGYHESGHYTTCDDLFLIAKAAYNNPMIKAAISKPSAEHQIKTGNVTSTITFNSTNMLIRPGNYKFAGANGMKTGTTDEAGNCLISTADRNGKVVICILTGAPTSNSRFSESFSLLTKAYEVLQ